MTLDLAIELTLSLMVGVALFGILWSLFSFPVSDEVPTHLRIAEAVGASHRQTLFEQTALKPLMSLSMTVARRMGSPALRNRVRQDLAASGNTNSYSPDEYLALCLVCMVGLGGVSALVWAALFQSFNPLILLLMMGVGFYLPLSTLTSQSKRRMTRISKQLPYTLDLIAMMIGAGSTFNEAIETLIRDNPEEDLNQELRIVRAEIEFGSTRATALNNLAERIPLDSLRSVVGAVNQAEELGTPLSQILNSQAGMLRMHRSVRAEKLSASASLRILVPSMLILFAVLMMVFAPFLMRMQEGAFLQ